MKRSFVFLTIAICFCIIFFTIYKGIMPVKYDIKTGDTAPFDVYATREVVDTVTTEKQRQLAAESVEEQFVLDNDITLRADRELANIFLEIAQMREEGSVDYKYSYCEGLSEQEFKIFRENVINVQQEIMNEGVSDTDAALEKASEMLRERHQSESAAGAGSKILQETIEVNKVSSEEKTKEAINNAKAAVPEVKYKQNQIIVRKGDIINQAQFTVLSDLGLIKGEQVVGILQILGSMVFTAMCFIGLYLFVANGKDKEKYPPAYPVLILVIITATVLLTYLSRGGLVNSYMIPVAAGGVLLCILIDLKVAMFVHTVIAVISAVCMGENVYYLGTVLFSGYIYIYLFSNISQRSKLVIASCQCAAVGAFIFFSVGLLQGFDLKNSVRIAGSGIINAVVSSVIIMGVLPFLETFFDALTPFRLLELSNPDNPLLGKLLKEAPGTYHHSLMVGNLAEAGCEAVGGNSLLARVGAYYHDVGKLSNPEMFTENQYGDNPHDILTPTESAKVIIAHVKDGADIVAQYKLPKAIKQIAACHHGTTAVSYFLYKAENAGEEVDKSLFCYKGPLPKTKEEAIIMFADSVEAAVRSLDDKSEENIRAMINKIIDGKITDGQLQKCPVTYAEITKISDAFIKVFGGYFHSRIKYPDKKSEKKDEN